MTRLYNHTRYSDEVLKSVFNFAARCAGVKGDVPVKITYCRMIRSGAEAFNGWPYRKTLVGKPSTSKDKRLLKCPRGWVEIKLPRAIKPWPHWAHDPPMYAAEWFVDVAIHEMAHIRQYRTGQWTDEFYWRNSPNRRKRHSKRPCEIDADNAVYEVHQHHQRNQRRQELVIQLAAELEERNRCQTALAIF